MFALSRPGGAVSPSSPISVSSSVLSDNSITKSAFYLPAPAVLPLPAYVAFAAASQLATDNHIQNTQQQADGEQQASFERSGALFTEQALALINAFLDELLYSFLCNARSMSLVHLEAAVENVLKGKLAQLALDSAHNELEDLLAEEDEVEPPGTPSGDDSLTQEEIDMIFKRSRLRIMVYMRLGEMEDEDEERYIQREADLQRTGSGGNSKRFSNSSRMVPWSAAIFLTSILEFIAEQSIAFSGENAYRRVKQRRTKQMPGFPSMGLDVEERVYVDEHDVEKLALNSILTRLWRIWRKNLRSRPKSRFTAAPTTPQTRNLNDKESSATLRTESALDNNRDMKDGDNGIGSDESDVLPKLGIAITAMSISQPLKREDLPNSSGTGEDSDSDVLGRPALSHISEERSQIAEYSDSNSNTALFPLTNRSSLHSHPAFDGNNYPPEIAAAAGLTPIGRAAEVRASKDGIDRKNSYNSSSPEQHPHLNGTTAPTSPVWAANVADRVLSQPTFMPSENAFAAQARAAEQAGRSRTNTASTTALDSDQQSEPPARKFSTSSNKASMDDSRPQMSADRKLSASLAILGQDRQGRSAVASPNSAFTLSPGDSEYSPAPALGVASIAQEFHARSITPPRSRETLREPKSSPPIIKKPLKIPRNVIPRSTPSDKSAVGGRRKSSLIAREPKYEEGSIRDFADFIRSTAPTEDQTRILPISVPTRSNGVHSTATSMTTPPSSASKPLPNLPRESASRSGPKSPMALRNKRQSTLEPRDAVIRDRGTDDLVDFLREGPPGATSGHGHTSSTENTPTSISTGGRNGSVLTQSHSGSVTSSTALVNNTVNNPRSYQKPNSAATQAREPQSPATARTRPRARDPYALPSSDEADSDSDSDNLTALPGSNRRQQQTRKSESQSLIDFLQSTDPPNYHSGPSSSLPSKVTARNNVTSAARRYDAVNIANRNTSSPPPRKANRTSTTPSSTARMSPNGRSHSPNPSNVLSTSAFYSTPNSVTNDSTTPPDFMATQPSRPIDLSELDRSRKDPMMKMYNNFDDGVDAAPSPTIMRDRGTKVMSGSGRKGGGSGFWKRGM